MENLCKSPLLTNATLTCKTHFWSCLVNLHSQHHLIDQQLYMLGNCTIISLDKQICFPHCTRPENIISVISSRWEMSQVLLTASLAKQQQWLTGYNMFPSDEEVVCSPDCSLLWRPTLWSFHQAPASNRRAMCSRGDKFTQVKTTSHCGVRLVTHCLVLDTHSCRCHDGFPSQGLT